MSEKIVRVVAPYAYLRGKTRHVKSVTPAIAALIRGGRKVVIGGKTVVNCAYGVSEKFVRYLVVRK